MEEIKAKTLLVIEENGDYYLIPHDEIVRFRVPEDQKAELNKLFGDEVTGYGKAWAETTGRPAVMGVPGGPAAMGMPGGPAAMGMPGGPAAMGVPGGPAAMGMPGGPAAESIGRPAMALWIGWPVKY